MSAHVRISLLNVYYGKDELFPLALSSTNSVFLSANDTRRAKERKTIQYLFFTFDFESQFYSLLAFAFFVLHFESPTQLTEMC